MEKKDANIVLQRIKTYYPKFFYASYTVENWYMELKDYDPEVIIQALRDYAGENAEPPSVINLKSIADRICGQNIPLEYKTFCRFCGRVLDSAQVTIHEDRCRSIKYMCRKYEEIYNKVLDKRLLWEISLEEFNKRYDDLLKVVLSRTTDEDEKFALGMYFQTMEAE